MAKEVVGSITSAVTGAVADKAVSKFVDNLGKQTLVADKLLRLERLHMRICSAIEVSEKYAIESTSLLRWQEDLKEAAARGGEVLLSFQRRQRDGNPQQASSSSASTGTAMSFTRNALSIMARRISTAASVLFSSDEDAKKLDGAVEALEKASENIGDFITLFHASPKLKRRRRCAEFLEMGPETAHGREIHEPTMLAEKLQETLDHISLAVVISEMRDIKGLEWLAHWTEVLRQARQQGDVLLQVLTAKAGKETTGYDLEDDDIRNFVRTIDGLAGDFDCFIQLTSFCPPIQRLSK